MLADLHTHSTASDGQYSPERLAALAKARGLDVLALTDHDTLDGVPAAVEAGSALGLRVVPGVELSAREYRTFHFLGYGVALDASALTDLCRRMKERRDVRNPQILAYLKERGVLLSMEQVQEMAGGDIIGRPHFAQAMVRQGYVASNREAFDRYLDTDAYHRAVDQGKPAAQECVDAIKAAGGKASLAHPYQIGLTQQELERLVRQLKDWGLDAIECYYPRHTAEQTAFYLKLAQKYDLRVTGGSDFHGERVKPDISLAAWELELDWLL